jgi:uracil-DNA glycosylase family 4
MGAEPVQDWQASVASALEWWQDAGVDALVADEPRDWLARPATRAPAPEAPPREPREAAPPPDLEAFLAWRLGPEAPEAGWLTPRLGATGPADAEWVLVTDMPEADDADRLMSGRPGALLDRMLAAIGLRRDTVHLLPLAAARPMTGRIPPEDEARLVELARHHLALVKPARLLLLGQAASRVLEETSRAGPSNRIHAVNYFGAKTQALASYHPRFLLERPAAKSEAWKHLLLLTRGTAE